MLTELSIKITDLTPPTTTPSLWILGAQSEVRDLHGFAKGGCLAKITV